MYRIGCSPFVAVLLFSVMAPFCRAGTTPDTNALGPECRSYAISMNSIMHFHGTSPDCRDVAAIHRAVQQKIQNDYPGCGIYCVVEGGSGVDTIIHTWDCPDAMRTKISEEIHSFVDDQVDKLTCVQATSDVPLRASTPMPEAETHCSEYEGRFIVPTMAEVDCLTLFYMNWYLQKKIRDYRGCGVKATLMAGEGSTVEVMVVVWECENRRQEIQNEIVKFVRDRLN